jgi:radical SAM protein with 4Fe4S-binding SPASM domain
MNYLLIKLYYPLVLIFKKAGLIARPFALSAETVRGCNLNCSNCPAGAIKGERVQLMEVETFRTIADRVYRHSFYLQLWFQGEPLLHPQWEEFILYARQRNMFTVMSTNGSLLSDQVCETLVKSGLHILIVSVDLNVQEASFTIGGDAEKIKRSISYLAELKKKNYTNYPLIEAQMVVTSDNENDTGRFRAEMKAAGADRQILKSAWFENPDDETLPLPSKYARYKKKPGGGHVPVKPVRNRCRRIFSTLVVASNGDVVSCCFDKDCRYKMGNVHEQSPQEIWTGKRFRDFRKNVLNNRKDYKICRNCSE